MEPGNLAARARFPYDRHARILVDLVDPSIQPPLTMQR